MSSAVTNSAKCVGSSGIRDSIVQPTQELSQRVATASQQGLETTIPKEPMKGIPSSYDKKTFNQDQTRAFCKDNRIHPSQEGFSAELKSPEARWRLDEQEVLVLSAEEQKTYTTLVTDPEDLSCPIACEIMSDPVVDAIGHTYDRKNIEKWFQNHPGVLRSPKSNEALPDTRLIPNRDKKSAISSWKDDLFKVGLKFLQVIIDKNCLKTATTVLERLAKLEAQPSLERFRRAIAEKKLQNEIEGWKRTKQECLSQIYPLLLSSVDNVRYLQYSSHFILEPVKINFHYNSKTERPDPDLFKITDVQNEKIIEFEVEGSCNNYKYQYFSSAKKYSETYLVEDTIFNIQIVNKKVDGPRYTKFLADVRVGFWRPKEVPPGHYSFKYTDICRDVENSVSQYSVKPLSRDCIAFGNKHFQLTKDGTFVAITTLSNLSDFQMPRGYQRLLDDQIQVIQAPSPSAKSFITFLDGCFGLAIQEGKGDQDILWFMRGDVSGLVQGKSLTLIKGAKNTGSFKQLHEWTLSFKRDVALDNKRLATYFKLFESLLRLREFDSCVMHLKRMFYYHQFGVQWRDILPYLLQFSGVEEFHKFLVEKTQKHLAEDQKTTASKLLLFTGMFEIVEGSGTFEELFRQAKEMDPTDPIVQMALDYANQPSLPLDEPQRVAYFELFESLLSNQHFESYVNHLGIMLYYHQLGRWDKMAFHFSRLPFAIGLQPFLERLVEQSLAEGNKIMASRALVYLGIHQSSVESSAEKYRQAVELHPKNALAQLALRFATMVMEGAHNFIADALYKDPELGMAFQAHQLYTERLIDRKVSEAIARALSSLINQPGALPPLSSNVLPHPSSSKNGTPADTRYGKGK